MFSFLCLHFIRPEPCNPTTVSLFGHAFLGLDSISYLGSSASCRGESCLLTVQVYGRLDISSVSSSLRRSFLSCTILSPREFCDKKLSSKKIWTHHCRVKILTLWFRLDFYLFGKWITRLTLLRLRLLLRIILRLSSEKFPRRKFFFASSWIGILRFSLLLLRTEKSCGDKKVSVTC